MLQQRRCAVASAVSMQRRVSYLLAQMEYAPLPCIRVRASPTHGLGVFTDEPIAAELMQRAWQPLWGRGASPVALG